MWCAEARPWEHRAGKRRVQGASAGAARGARDSGPPIRTDEASEGSTQKGLEEGSGLSHLGESRVSGDAARGKD